MWFTLLTGVCVLRCLVFCCDARLRVGCCYVMLMLFVLKLVGVLGLFGVVAVL